MACRLFRTKPLPEPVEGPLIWNVMTAMLRPCNNNAVITVITTRVVFIQIAKCTDRRARTMGHVGSEYVFCLKCSHCCVYFSVLELLQPVTPLLQPAPLADLGCVRVTIARRPNYDGLTIIFINADMRFPRPIYLTDLICNSKSFQILGFTVHPCMFCYLYSKHKAMFGETWYKLKWQ